MGLAKSLGNEKKEISDIKYYSMIWAMKLDTTWFFELLVTPNHRQKIPSHLQTTL